MRRLLPNLVVLALLSLPSAWSHAADAALGSIRGFVKFPGETPPRNMFANPQDHDCPHGIPQNHLIAKQETRGLANAVVIVERIDARVMPPLIQYELSTVGCQFKPRVQWVPQGTSLSLANKDGADHHLYAYRKNDTLFHVKLASGTTPVRRPLVVSGLYRFDCAKHPWERSWIYVSPHDSVAVTGLDGSFLIKNVPPGKYLISARHEGWDIDPTHKGTRLNYFPMVQMGEVVVKKGQVSEVVFDNLTGSLQFEP